MLHSSISFSKGTKEELAMVSSLCTDQSVNYWRLQKKGQACGQAICLVLNLILGTNSTFSVTLGKLLISFSVIQL